MFRKSDYFLWKWGFRSEDFSTSSAIILIYCPIISKVAPLSGNSHDYCKSCTTIYKSNAILHLPSGFADESLPNPHIFSVLQI
jgi:hypothetical protein